MSRVFSPIIPGEDMVSGAQIIDGSLRFVASKSQYLEKTFSSAGNRRTWTWSGWVKRAGSSASNKHNMFGTWNPSEGAYTTGFMLGFDDGTDDVLRVEDDFNNSDIAAITTAVFRDFSAGWYHIVLSMDTTQSTVGAGLKFYVNGVHRPEMSGTSWTQNHQTNINNGSYPHYLGIDVKTLTRFFDGEMSQVHFIDGQALTPSYFGYTDALTNTWRPKKFESPYPSFPNNINIAWSSLTSGGAVNASYPMVQTFDGRTTTTGVRAVAGGGFVFGGSLGIQYNSQIRIHSGISGVGTQKFKFNDGAETDFAENTWVTVTTGSGTFNKLEITAGSTGNANIYLGAVEVDGVILIDGAGWGLNGFYLPLDGNTPIGQDQSGRGNNWTPVNFGGSNTIEKATGALPILNTDGGGKVARVGVRTDAYASNLVVAMPLVGITTDVSNLVNSGTTAKTVTQTGSASDIAASSTQSNFYGRSAYFQGNVARLEISGGGGVDGDYDFGTGDFTMECWFYPTALVNTNNRIFCSRGDRNNYQLMVGSAGYLQFDISGTNYTSASSLIAANKQWYHLAVTRASGTLRLFINGVIVKEQASVTADLDETTGIDIGYETGFSSYINGYMQDARVYKGVAKYTQNFIPASTDPDILPDTPSGVSGSSKLTQITDGAVAFDGDGDYLTVSSSADYAFGTGDFTVECFVSNNQTSGNTPLTGHESSSTGSWSMNWYDGTFYWQASGSSNIISASSGSKALTGGWAHIAVTRSGTSLKFFINGIQEASATDSTNYNYTDALRVGATHADTSYLGYISNFHIVKGTALYTSNFTPPTAPISSVANTKLLCCKSPTSATAYDVSPGTITSVNAIATNFNPFTVNINTQRGQESGYCTLNPLDLADFTLSNGNLNYSKTSTTWKSVRATQGVNSGKWYYEFQFGSDNRHYIGISQSSMAIANYPGATSTSYSIYLYNGYKSNNASDSAYASAFASTDVLGVAFDLDASTITFYKNGISLGVAFTSIASGYYFPTFGTYLSGENGYVNFGQKPFKFPPPAGFQPLNASTARPSTIVARPDQYVGITTWTGNNTDNRKILTDFSADLVWVKRRDSSGAHRLSDTVRGDGNILYSDFTDAETIETTTIKSIDADGFTLGTSVGVNATSPATYVGWYWKAGGNKNTFNVDDVGYATTTAAGLTSGNITGASVGTKQGFSIIKYQGTGAVHNISHGLGKVPTLVLVKELDNSESWQMYHIGIGNGGSIHLNATDGVDTATSYWNNTTPTNLVFTLGSSTTVNQISTNYISYVWADVPGLQKFGSYTGNGSADGPMIVTGFRPRFLLLKATNTSVNKDWWILDSERNKYNTTTLGLRPNLSVAEGADDFCDFLSNGFKIRDTPIDINESGKTYIYAAFAETPSFNLYGGQANAR